MKNYPKKYGFCRDIPPHLWIGPDKTKYTIAVINEIIAAAINIATANRETIFVTYYFHTMAELAKADEDKRIAELIQERDEEEAGLQPETTEGLNAIEVPKIEDNHKTDAKAIQPPKVDLSPISDVSSPIVATNWTPERLLRAIQPMINRVQARLSPKSDTRPATWKQRRYLYVLTGINYGKGELSLVQASEMISNLTAAKTA